MQIGTLEDAYEFVLPLGKDQQSNDTGPFPQVTEALLQEESVRLEFWFCTVIDSSVPHLILYILGEDCRAANSA